MNPRYQEFVRFYLVDVKDIIFDGDLPPRDENLKKMAKEILETGILVTPLILKELGPMKYLLLSRKDEFVAAQIANEMDSERTLGGMVASFVIDKKYPERDKIEKTLLKQRTRFEILA